ncbi:MAG: adenylyltransferase/cytidyltransferase family protein [bacterium]
MSILNKKTVLIFGTFDIFHKGHKNFIKQARSHGDYLIAVIARDKTAREIKGAYPMNNEKQRLNTLLESGLVDKATLGSLTDKYSAIRKYKPAVICLGYDQTHFIKQLYRKDWQGIVIRLKPYKPHIYKSSLLKNS